ncbi:M23 family metallopeptidase [Flavobacterium sp. GT3R68]|uniref:M23 family metallopeptidase n=1 Tax=Flavobacterium sp. GT3R68 TaxID=2594437 RepID=UPI000F88A927|nr:M23 family metallopeptidase [Flavobacterium sp. GT3R68]RTY92456.1 M23 family metallopeptidase [Flavobacterium sp. GSN2]TRW94081.1 M23 family metallopeptidase [Flavobacterium sp. GT3R68]
MNKYTLIISLLLNIGSFAQTTSNITISIKPEKVYFERNQNNQFLNFDFLIENNSNKNLVLNAIEVSVFDENNKLAKRDFLNLYSRESLELVSQKPIASHRSKLLFNPFTVFDIAIPLKKLHYKFSFCNEDGKEHQVVTVDVSPELYQTKTNLILPVKGRILVWDGHDTNSHHRRFDYTDSLFIKRGTTMNFQRYGYDFVVVDELGTMYTGKPKINLEWYDDVADANSDYLGFGVPIHATGDGIINDVREGVEDNRLMNEAEILKNEKAYGGNYIIIDHQNGEFSWFGHLKQGSITVKKGQKVKQGEIIGAMGASGNSLFPHLHYELRNGDGAKHVEGLPSYFSNYTQVLGSNKVVVKKGLVNSGDILESK